MTDASSQTDTIYVSEVTAVGREHWENLFSFIEAAYGLSYFISLWVHYDKESKSPCFIISIFCKVFKATCVAQLSIFVRIV